MASGVKSRNDHKSDSFQQDQNNDTRCNNGDQRQCFNGAPMTDIPDDDNLAEVKMHNNFSKQQQLTKKNLPLNKT